MKKRKLLSIFIALLLVFSSALTASAESSSAEESISFLNSNKHMLDWYYSMRFENVMQKLESGEVTYEERQQLIEEINSLAQSMKNCLEGNHSYNIWVIDAIGPLDCTSQGVCQYCGHSEIILTGNGYRERHRDSDKNGICDDCERQMPYIGCDHFCHSENALIQKFLLPVFRIIWNIFGIEEYCRCGTYHFGII